MARSFLYKLFLSTIGRMPSQYDPEVDSWWGVILTELGLLDPFREENVSYFLMKFCTISLFAFFLCALSICNAYRNTKKERENVREHSIKGAHEYLNLHNKLQDVENKLCSANRRLQDANNGMDDERKENRDIIQDLDDQHLVDQEEIRSLKQHLSNTECDRDEYGRKLGYASRDSQRLTREKQILVVEKHELTLENQNLGREKQQLEALLMEKDGTISDLQAQRKDAIPEAVAAELSFPKYIQPNDETGMHQQMHQTLTTTPNTSDTDPDQAAANAGLAERDERIHKLEQQNGALTAEMEGLRTNLMDQSSAAEDVQRLKTLTSGLQVSRDAHAQCDMDSASQKSRIGELKSVKKQLEDTLRLRNDELATLQGRVIDLQRNHEGLQKTHAKCSEHANSQAMQLTRARDANGLLQASNDDLSQRLQRANSERADLIREGQRVEQQNQNLLNLRTCSQSETLSLQARIQTLIQRVESQQQHIHTLKTNCPRCQHLRVALDAVAEDVRMSDNESRAEIQRQIRQELISQVPDDLRRQMRGEVERSLREEFGKHYSDLFARNSKRIQELESVLAEQNAKSEKTNSNPTARVNHAACERKEGNLLASITKLQQDAKILQGQCSRLNNNAQNGREQLNRAQAANEDLSRELEAIKADQRRAQNVNPLQSKLVLCQREYEKMKVDRDKARDNCSIYSKNLSDLRKKYEALQSERSTLRERGSSDGDSPMEDGCKESLMAVDSERTIRTLQNQVAVLSKELEDRKTRSKIQDQSMGTQNAVPDNQTSPADEFEQEWSKRSFSENQSSIAPTITRDEATALNILRHEIDLRDARDGKKAVHAMSEAAACPAPQEIEGGVNESSTQDSDPEADDKVSEKLDSEQKEGETLDARITPQSAPNASRFVRQPAQLIACQPMNIGGKVGKKRERDEYGEGEADDEGGHDHKKVMMHHPPASQRKWAVGSE